MQRTAKILLVGWDSADWKMINRLIDEGKCNMKYLVENGTMGNMAALDPPFSLCYGQVLLSMRPDKHGILGFSEPDQTCAIRPVHQLPR